MTGEDGSLTVEAALVFPVFFFSILIFIYLIQIYIVQEDIQEALGETAAFISKYGYIYNTVKNNENNELKKKDDSLIGEYKFVANAINIVFIKSKFLELINKELIDSSCIKGGSYGITFFYSKIMTEKNIADIIASYSISFPVPFLNLGSYEVLQRVRVNLFSGRDYPLSNKENTDTNENTNKVYITDTGTVYHLSEECTHLKLSIYEVDYDSLDKKRNKNGGRYRNCERCNDLYKPEKVYITSYGDRYHMTLGCSGLKRTVITISKLEADGYSKCKRCGIDNNLS